MEALACVQRTDRFCSGRDWFSGSGSGWATWGRPAASPQVADATDRDTSAFYERSLGYTQHVEPTTGKVAVERDLPPPPKERQLKRLVRQWRSRGRHRGLRYWFITTGLPILVVYSSLFLANGVAIGWANSYEVMIGITSPAKTTMPTLAWGLSVAGWLLAPGLAGAVAGYVVSNSINSRRSRTVNELFNQTAGRD